MSDIATEVRGAAGLVTLNRPRALNALSLEMVRDLTACLLAWRDDPAVALVAIRGQGREGPFGVFCAGGDIRFFHQAALAGDPRLEDFFTEEYALDHLIHRYPKPCVAFMDGIVMGGGMGIAQGASLRIATERTQVAMPETLIGLFPDVGGGYFLSRCPGSAGEYLALTGESIGSAQAIAFGLADVQVASGSLPRLWDAMASLRGDCAKQLQALVAGTQAAAPDVEHQARIDRYFSLPGVHAIVDALESAGDAWAARTAAQLRRRSPLMLHVALEQVRRGRSMTLAQNLRMERGLMRHCFAMRPGPAGESVEGIRALAIDKDQAPKWHPARIEDVDPALVQAFFAEPWPAHAHPLRGLGGD